MNGSQSAGMMGSRTSLSEMERTRIIRLLGTHSPTMHTALLAYMTTVAPDGMGVWPSSYDIYSLCRMMRSIKNKTMFSDYDGMFSDNGIMTRIIGVLTGRSPVPTGMSTGMYITGIRDCTMMDILDMVEEIPGPSYLIACLNLHHHGYDDTRIMELCDHALESVSMIPREGIRYRSIIHRMTPLARTMTGDGECAVELDAITTGNGVMLEFGTLMDSLTVLDAWNHAATNALYMIMNGECPAPDGSGLARVMRETDASLANASSLLGHSPGIDMAVLSCIALLLRTAMRYQVGMESLYKAASAYGSLPEDNGSLPEEFLMESMMGMIH